MDAYKSFNGFLIESMTNTVDDLLKFVFVII